MKKDNVVFMVPRDRSMEFIAPKEHWAGIVILSMLGLIVGCIAGWLI